MKLAGLAVLLAGLTLTASAGPSAADVTCATHTAWAGSETSTQHNTATLAQLPTAASVTLTHLTISASYVQRTGPAGFSEVLLLVGVSAGPVTVGPHQLPAFTPDSVFTAQTVTTGAAGHNENQVPAANVIAARILKSYTGDASALIDLDLSEPVPAGGVLWVYYGSVSAQTLDPEVQTVVTYMRCGG